MSDNTRIIKNSGILYVRLLITTIVGLISTRLVLQALGVSDYGLYSIVAGIVVMMGFLNTVMISTTYRYIAYEMGKNNYTGINQVFNISLIIHFCLAVLLILLAETLGRFYINNYLNVLDGKVDDALFVFRFSVWATFFSIISIPYQGLITAQENFLARASIEVIRSLARLGSVLIVTYYLGNQLRLYSVLMMIVMIVPPVLFYLYCNRKYSLLIRCNFQKEWSKYKEMIAFSGWVMFGGAASVGKSQGSALIINLFFGTILNVSFGIANQVNNLISMFSRNLGQAAIPQITKSYSGGNTDRSTELVLFISKYSFFLILLPALPILLEIDFILQLWLKEIPEYTSVFVKLMIIYALIETMSSGLSAVIQASGKIKWFMILYSAISLLSLPIAYYLFTLGLPPYSITIVYILTLILASLTDLILLKKILSFDVKAIFEKVYLRIFAVVVLLIPLFYIRDLMPMGLSRFIIISILSVLLYFVVIYFVGIEKQERKIIVGALKKVINFKRHTND